MSVVTGNPVRLFTASKVRKPACSPGPRNDLLEVRFALSKDALNTNGKARRSASSRSRSAIRNVRSCDSITQGPAIHKSGWPRPQRSLPIATARTDSMIYPPWLKFSADSHNRAVLQTAARFTLYQGKFGTIRRSEELAWRGKPSNPHRAQPATAFQSKDRRARGKANS